MKVEVQKSFEKDIFDIRDKNLAQRVQRVIEELEACRTISEVRHLKKIRSKGTYYRIRVGSYRLGLKLDHGVLILLRFMHRQEVYKYFP
jgi:mRNA interferase RelE/StbE